MDGQNEHKLTLVNRKNLDLEGVRHVGSFDEREIVLETSMGILSLKGEGLHISKLSLDDGTMVVQGYIVNIEYKEGKSGREKSKNLLSRIMR